MKNKSVDDKIVITPGKLIKFVGFILVVMLFSYSVTVYFLAGSDVSFAENYNGIIGKRLRALLAGIFSIFPFSVAETVVVISIPLFIVFLIRAIVLKTVYGEKGRLLGFLGGLGCVVMLLAVIFINTFGISYRRHSVSQLYGIDTAEISGEDMLNATVFSSVIASGLSDNISHKPNGESVMPYTFDEMVVRIHNGYKAILPNIQDNVSVKPVALSELWMYTYISGMYFPFTGESNINMCYPDYAIAFTTAHELAHQFGFADETDANMMAFLALSFSNDDYLIYSAYVNAYDYLLAELDEKTAGAVVAATDTRIIKELRAYYSFLDGYRNKTISKISHDVNDAYLKSNGVEDGVKSYSRVSTLMCGFIKEYYGKWFGR